jgi:hypothetical protein
VVAASAGGPPGCHTALVNAKTLALFRQKAGSCEDPNLFYEPVLPVVRALPGEVDASTLQVARALAGGGFRVGPVLDHWTDVAGAALEAAYGGGYLWIYVPLSARGGEVFAVSGHSARVERTKAPEVASPLIFAGAGGLWFAGRSSLAPPFEPGVYFLPPAGGGAELVARAGGARWLVGWQTQVWLGTSTRTLQLAGTKVVHQWARSVIGTAYAAGPHGFVWALMGRPCARTISQLDVGTGAVRVVAALPAPHGCRGRSAGAALAWAGGYLWALAGGEDRSSYLYRVTLPS